MVPDGPAAMTGRIRTGDVVTRVNNFDCRGVSLPEARKIVKSYRGIRGFVLTSRLKDKVQFIGYKVWMETFAFVLLQVQAIHKLSGRDL